MKIFDDVITPEVGAELRCRQHLYGNSHHVGMNWKQKYCSDRSLIVRKAKDFCSHSIHTEMVSVIT